MPINSEETTGLDLSALLEGLIKADVKFILVGGLAAVVHAFTPYFLIHPIILNSQTENRENDRWKE